MERYFAVNGLNEAEQLMAAGLCMEGRALAWFRWREERSPIRSWGEFKESVIERFRSVHDGSPKEQFYSLVQTGSVMDYRDRFELLSSQTSGISDSDYMANFLKGLKPEVRAAVRTLNPRNLASAMTMAQLVEDQRRVERAGRGPSVAESRPPLSGRPSLLGQRDQGRVEAAGPVQGGMRPAGEFMRLTETEYQAKRAKGLCFKCDERFVPGHRCKNPTLQVLLMDDENDTIEEKGDGTEDEGDHQHLDMAEVTLNSVVGLTPSNTMKVRGRVGDRDVVVLIDSGATHNFISARVVEKLDLRIEKGASYGVTFGNGAVERSRGICRGVVLTLPEIQVHADFLPLPLGSTDLILGMAWLQTLGATAVNWKKLTMQFETEGRLGTLNGDPSLCRLLVSLKAQRQIIPKGWEAVWVALRRLGADIVANQSKISAMVDWPVPKALKGLRGFLGRFVKGYSAIAWALMKQRGSRLRSCTYSFWNSTLRTRFLIGRGVVMRLLLGGLG